MSQAKTGEGRDQQDDDVGDPQQTVPTPKARKAGSEMISSRPPEMT